MPCDSIYKVKVKLGIDTDIDIMKVALEDEGYSVNIYGVGKTRVLSFSKNGRSGTMNEETGYIEHDQRLPFDVQKVEMAYGRAIVTTQAEQYGWQLEIVDGNKNHIRIHR